MMLIYLSSLSIFIIFILFGNLMLFLSPFSYYLIILYAISELFLTFFYQEINFKALEIKDFILSFIIILCFIIFYKMNKQGLEYPQFCYLYLTTYLSLLSYACSFRYKSLI
ncbi:MAG: hypothetical protein RR440_02960 [Erysipelotrichaceae bacterium]